MEEKKKTLTLTLHANGIISHPASEVHCRFAERIRNLVYSPETMQLWVNKDLHRGLLEVVFTVDEHQSRRLMDAWIRGEHCEIEVEDR